MRPRDLTRLESGPYDLLVVGGGIHGLACAYDAASRGLRVALVEADDFGSGASFNHQKTAHGGLRALGSGRLGLAREAVRERRALARMAPWLLRPLPFLVGTYRSAVRNRLALRAAFKLDAWIGRRRNEGVEPELHLPAPRLVSKAATLRLFAGVRPDRLTGGAQWYDYQMVESDRLTLAFAAAADRAGADLANHAEAVEALKDGGRITGMLVRDRLTGQSFPVRAGVTLNAAGARAGDVMAMVGVRRPFPLLRAINLVTSKRASDMALGAPAPGGRMLTLVPWRGRAIVGTGQSATFVGPGDTAIPAAELDGFIADANHAFPALKLSRGDVTLVHRGVVPAVEAGGRPVLKSSPEILDHAAAGANGAITVVGVKYTSARALAERTTRIVAKRLGKPVRASRTADATLPGAGIADHEALAIETARDLRLEVPLPTIRHLMGLYAEGAAEIVRLMHERADLRAPVASDVKTVGAEVVHAIRREMAVRLADIVVRRTGLGSAGAPPDEAVAACARIASAELGWDQSRVTEEIAAVGTVYAMPGAAAAVKEHL
jgi:glycerol-3-phosphate dehydrogenase